MTNTLAAGTVIKHPANGDGRVLSLYDDNGIDMVEILWLSRNSIEDVREDALTNCLTVASQSAKSLSPWLALLGEEE